MTLPSEEHVIPVALPKNETGTDDARILAIADILETLAFKMYHSALRFEDDGQPHIPTYGLRLAADEFSRSAHLIFRQSIPIPVPIKISLRSHIKTVAIGIRAFARSLEHDWNMVKVKCGAHCKLCTSRCNYHMIDGIFSILKDVVDSDKRIKMDAKQKKEMKAVFDNAAKSMVDYEDVVLKSNSFEGTSTYWDEYANDFEKISEYFYEIL